MYLLWWYLGWNLLPISGQWGPLVFSVLILEGTTLSPFPWNMMLAVGLL